MSTHTEMKVGSRVALATDVDRFPNFVANKGEMGTVTVMDTDAVYIKMDNHIDGAEEWNNEIGVGEAYGEQVRNVLVVL